MSANITIGPSRLGGIFRAYCYTCQETLAYWEDPEGLAEWKQEHAHEDEDDDEDEIETYEDDSEGIYYTY